MTVCIGCDSKDEIIKHHAEIIAQIRKEKMAYRAALIQITNGINYKELLQAHMERLGG